MRDLPPPLPPEKRTIGQLIAETIRAYGDRFWRLLPLGLPLAIADQLSVREHIPRRWSSSGPARRSSSPAICGPAVSSSTHV